MLPTITAFERSPDRGRGLARDMRVRWALEEVGQPYAVRLLSFEAMQQPAHRARHPFGQIPTYEQDGLVLFESGAIVLHIAQTHPGLLPEAPDARLRAVSWMFAALNTIEPPVFERALCVVLERQTPWFAERLETLDKRVRQRLGELSLHLGQSPWLDGEFSAGDLLMLSVLLRLQGSTLLEEHPNLLDYLARGIARPAFQRAFQAQAEVFLQAQQADAQASPGPPGDA
ncbi:glutathione S-transferase family protein [Pseudoxanthomonas sp. UC19_8]|uniref:glutathione S-transferase family protein n=1 Tax=Pseudoxanthomonas sp. UC19_8 TaxID=3350175 RepID=UPI0036D42DCA